MPSESWAQIHRQQREAPTTGWHHTTPRVPNPVCPDHCSGRHVRDAVLQCPHCAGIGYEIVGHEYLWTESHYFWEVRPVNGSSPPRAGQCDFACRDCGETLRRR